MARATTPLFLGARGDRATHTAIFSRMLTFENQGVTRSALTAY
jgi:hypothetical protein